MNMTMYVTTTVMTTLNSAASSYSSTIATGTKISLTTFLIMNLTITAAVISMKYQTVKVSTSIEQSTMLMKLSKR